MADFSLFSQRERTLLNPCLLSCAPICFWDGSSLNANNLLFRDPTEKGDKIIFDKVASPASVAFSVYLKIQTYKPIEPCLSRLKLKWIRLKRGYLDL